MGKRGRLCIAWGLSVAWMAVIYLMSAMPGDVSGAQSGRLMALLLRVIEPVLGTIDVSALHLLIRKGAHMAEYAVLFWLYRHALHLSGVRHAGLAALCMSVGYAATDEVHQGFVAGRGPSAVDVMIDGCGAAIAWAIWAVIARARRKRAA